MPAAREPGQPKRRKPAAKKRKAAAKRAPATKRGRGRPRVELPEPALKLLETLGRIHCKTSDIAAALTAAGWPIARSTLWANYGDRLKVLKADGHARLRQAQWAKALGPLDEKGDITTGGSDTMMIWLGKQELGQRDVTRREVGGIPGGAPVQTQEVPDESEGVREVMVVFGRRIPL